MSSANSTKSIAQLALKIEQKELSPVELTNDMLARIDALNPHMHAYNTVTAELASQRGVSHINPGCLRHLAKARRYDRPQQVPRHGSVTRRCRTCERKGSLRYVENHPTKGALSRESPIHAPSSRVNDDHAIAYGTCVAVKETHAQRC